jgi:hypothetical protein
MKSDKERLEIVSKALLMASEFIRQNPPAMFPDNDYSELVMITAGGLDRDPDGREYAAYFINKAIKELRIEED